jgi:hypothetical protein
MVVVIGKIFMYEDIKAFFDSLGWIANALAIITVVIPCCFFAYNKFARKSFPTSFDELYLLKIQAKWGQDSPKKLGTIAIVDDELSDFPVKALKDAGYNITPYKQVTLNDIGQLSLYDVVFLDMYGIVKDDIKEGGLKLIAKLREINPRQKICAVSSKTFDPTATQFFKLADEVKKKPMTAQDCQDVIDLFLKEKLDPKETSIKLDETIDHTGKNKVQLVSKVMEKARNISPEPCINWGNELVNTSDSRTHSLIDDMVRILRHAAS